MHLLECLPHFLGSRNTYDLIHVFSSESIENESPCLIIFFENDIVLRFPFSLSLGKVYIAISFLNNSPALVVVGFNVAFHAFFPPYLFSLLAKMWLVRRDTKIKLEWMRHSETCKLRQKSRALL